MRLQWAERQIGPRRVKPIRVVAVRAGAGNKVKKKLISVLHTHAPRRVG